MTGGDLMFSLVIRATPDAEPQKADSIWRCKPVGYDVITAGEVRHFRAAMARCNI